MSRHKILDPNGESRVTPNHCALGIMTKAPEAGKVKTRLTPPLTGEEAATLNICFLIDLAESILTTTEQAPTRGIGIYTPDGAEAVYENILPDDFFLLPQRGNDFGERLTFAAEDLFKVGFESVCLINSDSPTVAASNFIEAARELAKPGDRTVLGPSEDGGYYLIGLKQVHPRLFEEIDWSTEHVFNQTLHRASEVGVKVHKLPIGFDVDDGASLRRLCDELLGKTQELSAGVAPNTQKFLSEIVRREGRDRIWPRL
jgi:rSAM/selenodomain-associated transferase 1